MGVGRSWIRSKYVVTLMGKCIQCVAERDDQPFVKPDDFPCDPSLLPEGWVDTPPVAT